MVARACNPSNWRWEVDPIQGSREVRPPVSSPVPGLIASVYRSGGRWQIAPSVWAASRFLGKRSL